VRRRVFVPRARADAERTAAKLYAFGFEPVISPVLEIVATGAALPQGDYDAVLATSAKGLEHAGEAGALRALPLHAVGARTARAAEAIGWRPCLVAGNARALLPLLRARYEAPARFLYLAGRDRRAELEDGLRAQGHDAAIVETYEARAASALTDEAKAAIANGGAVALHYSRRGVEIFLALAREAGLTEQIATLAHLALSQDVAEPLRRLGLAPRVAEKPDEEHLLRLLDRPSE
jgi:uroporphyrinogen-III synthase